MKITPRFTDDPGKALPGSLTLVSGTWDPEELRRISLEKSAVLVGGPMEREGRLEMVCAVEGRLHRQSMCFPPEPFIPGTDVEPVSTPFGTVGLCCGEDIFQPMYSRLAALKGCTLLIVRLEQMDETLLIPGPWSACQSNCLPVFLSAGDSTRLILPCAMTEKGDGFGEESFHTEALEEAYRSFPIFHSLNKAFYRRYREVLTK